MTDSVIYIRAPGAAEVRARDERLSAEERLDALREWIAENKNEAADFIVSELKRSALETQWRRIVVYAAEELRFPAEDLKDVAGSLVNIATELRNSSAPDDVPVVMCAVRRAGSLLSESAVTNLAPFLMSGFQIDTRLVALQAIGVVFHSVPPSSEIDLCSLADRAAEIGAKHWDPDVFRAGEVSALAIEAAIVATILGSPKAIELAKSARATNRPLLFAKVRKRLEGFLERWKTHEGGRNRVHPLEAVISELNAK